MPEPPRKTVKIIPNIGNEFTVQGTLIEFNDESNRIKVWDGSNLVASVAGGSFYIVT